MAWLGGSSCQYGLWYWLCSAEMWQNHKNCRWVINKCQTWCETNFSPFHRRIPLPTMYIWARSGKLGFVVGVDGVVGGVTKHRDGSEKYWREFKSSRQIMLIKCISYLAITSSPRQWCIFESHMAGWGWWLVWVMLWTMPQNIASSKKDSGESIHQGKTCW